VITNAGSACGTPRWTRHERRSGELACTAGSSPPMTSSTSSTHQPRQPHRRHLPVINQCASDPKPCRGSVHGWRRHLRPVIQHRHHDGRGVLRPAHRSNRPATGRRSPLRRSAETCSTIPTRASAPAAVGSSSSPVALPLLGRWELPEMPMTGRSDATESASRRSFRMGNQMRVLCVRLISPVSGWLP